eukprot:Skav201389  [mRNA]  locus=scaffold296:71718:84763:+ [translate_table: standard]
MTSSLYQRMPLDKRPDFYKILSVAGLYTIISGMINGGTTEVGCGIAVVELTTPVGYTSGGCVNAGASRPAAVSRARWTSGRFYAAGDMKQGSKVLAMCTLYYAGGRLLAGIWPKGCDGDLVFEGKTSPGMLFSSLLVLLGIWLKRHRERPRPTLAMQCWALSQGLMNATSSSFSAAPMRSTHTAGGQTDAAMSLGKVGKPAAQAMGGHQSTSPRRQPKALMNFLRGEAVPCQRKVYLNAVCCAGRGPDTGQCSNLMNQRHLGVSQDVDRPKSTRNRMFYCNGKTSDLGVAIMVSEIIERVWIGAAFAKLLNHSWVCPKRCPPKSWWFPY